LFDIESTLSFNTDKLVRGKQYDYVTRTSTNQGVLQSTGFVNKENINKSGIWSLGLLQMDFFYRKKEWYAGQFVRKITPKILIPENCIPFFTTVLNKQKPKLLSVLVRNVDSVFKNIVIRLPIRNTQINFDFMGDFITELEQARVAELEAYLIATGLKDYALTDEEQRVLNDFDKIGWDEYRIGDLFEKVKTRKLSYKANDLPKEATGKYVLPCLTSSFRNQGLNYFVPKKGVTILKNVISIPSNSDVYRAYFQSREFTVLSDAYAIRCKLKEIEFTSAQYLFIALCINKVTDLPIYSYKNKLGGWNVVQNKHIQIPIKDSKPDFAVMNTFISAIQKLAIKDVVLYADVKATKKAVNTSDRIS